MEEEKIERLYEDEDWLMFVPLTFEAAIALCGPRVPPWPCLINEEEFDGWANGDDLTFVIHKEYQSLRFWFNFTDKIFREYENYTISSLPGDFPERICQILMQDHRDELRMGGDLEFDGDAEEDTITVSDLAKFKLLIRIDHDEPNDRWLSRIFDGDYQDAFTYEPEDVSFDYALGEVNEKNHTRIREINKQLFIKAGGDEEDYDEDGDLDHEIDYALRTAGADAESAGAYDDFMKDFETALEEAGWRRIGRNWVIEISAQKMLLSLIDDEPVLDLINIDEPNGGWSGWDSTAFNEYLESLLDDIDLD